MAEGISESESGARKLSRRSFLLGLGGVVAAAAQV
ncbi:MAG: hypothetical protein G01um10147_923 [Microgenomates group bacterium Gr01-1014_7]|nr:MAG: hypothetical protein G01um10147_923 [Microgenomates group bacterium Gr01-1014_7]